MRNLLLRTALLSGAVTAALAAAETRPITARDLWACKRLASPALSPDGRTAVFTVQEWSVGKNSATANLWLADTGDGRVRRLTAAAASEGSPQWSPDGRRIAFTSQRGDDETAALYVIAVDGGEAEKILELPYGVSSPRWLPDGSGLVVATSVIPELAGTLAPADLAAMKAEIKKRKASKMSAKVTENRIFRYWDRWLTDNLAHRLVRVDLATRRLTDLTPASAQLFSVTGDVSFELSPDGRHVALALNTSPPPYGESLNTDIALVAADGSGTLKILTPENPASDSSPRWSPDGRSIFYQRLSVPNGAGEVPRLWRHDLAGGKNSPVTAAHELSFESVGFSDGGATLWLTAEQRGHVPIFKAAADGTGLAPVHAGGTATSLVLAGGKAVFLHETTSRPPELFALDLATGAVRQLTRFNEPLLASLALGRVESYTFAGAGGAEVQGWLVFPPGYDPAKKYPLVQLMHGGPHTMVRDAWSYRWNSHVFAAPGYVVTWVNRHGSTGFGQKFAQSIVGAWGEKPLEDILKSTDFLLARHPNLDPQRLAAAGASYGGYMATWVLGHTDRFACIVNHAGVSDYVTQFGSDLTNYGFVKIMGGTPWENPAGMQRNNPVAYAKNFKTPTLVIHGEKDYRVPYVHGTALYGILQSMRVPSRLVIYPDENHWILTPQNSIHWNWEVQAWLARWLGLPAPAEPVFEPEK